VVNPNFRVDPNLQDERGYTADLGLRGNVAGVFSYDVTGFYLAYANRIGTVLRVDSVLFNVYRFRTNVAESRTVGVESYLELDVWRLAFGRSSRPSLSAFANSTFLDGRYLSTQEAAFNKKRVEQVPPFMVKTGLQFKHLGWMASLQYSYTAQHFSDATNAQRTPSAVEGVIPSYWIMDATAGYTWKYLQLTVSVNNLTNNYYFTRRASGYPGPGIIPSEGRAVYATLQLKLP
jgi:Fe(3+) dicitrate transport protein